MAHPADTAPKAPGAFASARLSPEEAERLAATFRPSWELDDAPFTGPGTLSDGDLKALQGGGTHAEVRAAVQTATHATNGHAPPPATITSEPESSVIIDVAVAADASPAPAPQPGALRPGATMLGMAAPQLPPPVLEAAPEVAPNLPPPPASFQPGSVPVSKRPSAPDFNVPPPPTVVRVSSRPPARAPVRAKAPSIDVEYPKKSSKTGLWAGLGVGGVALVGLVVWAVAGSGSGKTAEPAPIETRATNDKLSAIPPPPPATATTTAAASPAPPPATTAAAAPPAPAPIPTTPVTALPQAAAVATHAAAAAAAPRPNYGGAPAPRPAGRPKGGQTIVRDAPF